MKEQEQGKTIYTNFFWRLLERCGAQGVTFIVSLVLARILDPDTYGTMALITVVINLLQVFVDCGWATALIQKKDADDLDFSSVFFFNILFCTVLYVAVFFAAPYIALFYERDYMTPMIRVVGLLLFISAFKNVQQAYVSRHMMFKKFFYSTLGGTIGAAVVGIWMAIAGYGIWALIAQLLFNAFMDTLILWFTVKWRPKWMFSWQRLKGLFRFGWKLLASNLVTVVYNDVRQLIIGKVYSTSDLAFYNRGNQLPYYIVININSSIDSVLLPVMSQAQDSIDRVRDMMRRSIRVGGFLIWPMMAGFAACSESLVRIILTEKWLPAIPYIWVFCLTYGLFPITTANSNAIKAIGKSGVFLGVEIAQRITGLLLILAAVPFGPIWIAVSALLNAIISQAIHAIPNYKILHYSYWRQLKDIFPSLGLALVMGGIVYAVKFLGLNDWLTLLIQVPLGVGIYLGGAKLLKFDSFDYVWNTVKGFRHKTNHDTKADASSEIK